MKYGITINTNFLIHCLHDCLYVINPSKTKHLSSVKIKLMINIKWSTKYSKIILLLNYSFINVIYRINYIKS